MNYTFKTKQEYVKFLSNLREGAVGNEATIYFDDKAGKAIKIFALNNPEMNMQRKEKKLRELMKYKDRFPNAALPEDVITCQGKCVGYTMPMLKGCTSLKTFPTNARNQKDDLKYRLRIACKLAEFVEALHKEDIIIGDFHPDQFMVKNDELYICDTDTWGFETKGADYTVELSGRPEYIDPNVRVFDKKGVFVKKYTKSTDHFALAVVVFEILVGFHPFDGKYPIVKEYKRPLRAYNRISIIGNHDLQSLNSFQIKHVAWMSEELNDAFIKIFETGKRFNILKRLKNQEKDLVTCRRHGYYSSRYSKCPMCSASKYQDSLKKFRTSNVDKVSYEKYYRLPESEVRKVVDEATYFDFDKNVVHIGDDGNIRREKISPRTDKCFFTKDGMTIKVEKMSKVKQLFSTLLGKASSIYGNCSFFERIKKCFSAKNPACTVEVYNENGNKLFSTILLLATSMLKIYGQYLFYIKDGKELIRVYMTPRDCVTKSIFTSTEPFAYEGNEKGECCICKIDKSKFLDILIDGVRCEQVPLQIPKAISYDSISGKWCIIAKDKKVYNTFIVMKDKTVKQQFEAFSYGGLNISNSIFYNSMLVIPCDKRLIFLKSGSTVEKSTVIEKDLGIVDSNSKISMQEDKIHQCTYLIIQDSTQVCKIPLN